MTHHVDLHVGDKIRRRRWMLGVTQKQLADCVGIRFQQIQKYEVGTNRVSASRLFEIAEALNVTTCFFFDGLKDGANDNLTASEVTEPGISVAGSGLVNRETDREAFEMIRCYFQLPEKPRRRLLELTRSLAVCDEIAEPQRLTG